MKHLLNISYIIILTVVFSSCTEKIDINLDKSESALVVEGAVSEINGQQRIKLSKTAEYFSNQAPTAVSNALVTIDDGTESVALSESELKNGYYYFPDEYSGVVGKTYTLNINLENEIAGKKEYTAQTTIPPLSDDIDSIAVEWNSRFEAWLIKFYATDPPRKDYYMFNGMKNGELITDSIQNVNISDDRLYNGNYTYGIAVMFLDGDKLEPGDIFTLVLSNITEEYANFVTEVQTEISPGIPLFSGPPANVSSNISNGALGWFTAYRSAFTSTVVGERIDPEE
ncbi:MAG: hypothetical protein C0595_11725 [Marinilabiliales bacterium]|nr:MAG: hypothetical protein C0595_11725 [Marinilabiliales bacterium]